MINSPIIEFLISFVAISIISVLYFFFICKRKLLKNILGLISSLLGIIMFWIGYLLEIKWMVSTMLFAVLSFMIILFTKMPREKEKEFGLKHNIILLMFALIFYFLVLSRFYFEDIYLIVMLLIGFDIYLLIPIAIIVSLIFNIINLIFYIVEKKNVK